MKVYFNLITTPSLFAIMGLLMFGCSQKNTVKISSVATSDNDLANEKECLPPLFAYAYPDRDESGSVPPGMLPETLPQPESEIPSYWIPQLTSAQLKTFEPELEMTTPSIRSDIIEIVGDDIWFSDSVYILRYDKKGGEIKTYKIFDVGHVMDLYADSQGTLWAAIDKSPSSPTPLLKYDPNQDQFEAVPVNNNLLASDQDHIATQIIGRFDGKLWIVFSKQLYAFDLEIGQAMLASGVDKEIKIYHAAMAQDGNIWFVAEDKSNVENILIYQYNPQTDQIKIAGAPPGGSSTALLESLRLGIDEKGRIWIGGLGWFEPIPDTEIDPSYPYPFVRSYRLLPSNSFIIEGGIKYKYGLAPAVYVNPLSDGTIWYSTYASIVRFDPSTGKWCILARNVPGLAFAEDNDHFVWFAYGQLYKYSAENK